MDRNLEPFVFVKFDINYIYLYVNEAGYVEKLCSSIHFYTVIIQFLDNYEHFFQKAHLLCQVNVYYRHFYRTKGRIDLVLVLKLLKRNTNIHEIALLIRSKFRRVDQPTFFLHGIIGNTKMNYVCESRDTESDLKKCLCL